MKKIINNYMDNCSGATAIEYGLIAALIAVAIITGITAIGDSIKTTLFDNIANQL